MEPVNVLLVEDHTLVRVGMRMLLQSIPGIMVVAEAKNGQEALDLIAEHHPQVVLMDIAMPILNGIDATALVVQRFPGTKVIVLSMHVNEEYVWQALRAGASGYLLKDSGPPELELAITAALQGETYLSPVVSSHVTAYIERVGGEKDAAPKLTPRQREILQLIAQGHTTQAVAQALNISVKTVETHRAQLMDRLGIHDVPGLVRYAIRMGLVTPHD